MTTQQNRAVMEAVFAELAKGNGQPFREAMAEDFVWTITGSTAWSRSYRGTEAVSKDLLRPLYAQFKDRYTNTAERIFADGDHVIIQCKGRVTTVTGAPYNNSYCFVVRMDGGKMKELVEYCDTALIERVLQPPA